MLNIQNLIILIVLLATTLVNSALNWRQRPDPPSQVTEEEIRIFVSHVEHFRCKTWGILDGINHLKSWPKWNYTPNAFKENCVILFRNELNNAGLNEHLDTDKLGKLAYKALDKEITECVTYNLGLDHIIEGFMKNDPHMSEDQASLLAILPEYLARNH